MECWYTNKPMRIVIIGAGPCGLGAANRLKELGIEDFTVYDRNSYVGGLASSFCDEKEFTWDFGVHVAHSHYTYVDRLMDALLPDGFYHHQRMSWVREYGRFIPYPFQYNIRHLPDTARQECVDGLLAMEKHKAKGPPANFRDWILSTVGDGIAKHFMVPYNRKIWCVDPAEMNCQWLGDRVPVVDVQRVLRNIEQQKDDVSWGPNATFQFPKTGGTGAIWESLADRVGRDRIRLSTELVSLDPQARTARFSDGTVEKYDHLISTMPLTRLTKLCGVDPIHRRAQGLRHTHVYVVGVAPEFPIPEPLKDKTWIYCPEDACAFYRVTPFSTFSPAHVPDINRYCSFLCEISTPWNKTHDRSALIPATIEGLRAIGLVEVDPAKTHFHLMTAEYGYPIPTIDRDAILGDVLPALEKMNIYSRGRFGGWKYEAANMDHSIMQGVEAVDRIVNGTPEVTLPSPSVVNAGKN
ncbi:MAG: FAD-dependent oxidoreductase [bacterium]